MAPKSPPSLVRRPLAEEFDRRILLSAELQPLALDPALETGDDAHPIHELELHLDGETAAAEVMRLEIAFIDASLENRDALVADLEAAAQDRRLEVVLLDPDADGVAQIGDALASRDGIGAVHVLTHGAPGAVQLGSTWLTGESLDRHAEVVASWGDALTADADLLFYGCDLASGEAGRDFVSALGLLTGADVAASIDATGAAGKGGDWVLEHRDGALESAALAGDALGWEGLLSSQPAVWLSTDGDAVGSGNPGLDSWLDGTAVRVGDPGFAIGSPTQASTDAPFDLEVFSVQDRGLDAIHFVTRDLTVGGADSFDLREGDLLLSSTGPETFVSTNSLQVRARDVFVFRPDAPGDYSSGTFHMLLEGAIPRDIRGLTLVEADTQVGDILLEAGDFLFTARGANEQNQIQLFQTQGVGAGATQGTVITLLDGSDAGLGGFDVQIQGLELLEEAKSLGGVTLDAGTLLVSFETGGPIGSNGLEVLPHDVVRLDVGTTTVGAGEGNGSATAAILFRGSDLGLDAGGGVDALSLGPAQPDVTLELPGLPATYVENAPALAIDPGAVIAYSGSAGWSGGSLGVTFVANGTASDALTVASGNGVSVASGTLSYDGGSGAVVIGSVSGGQGGAPLTVTFNASADAAAVQAVARNVSFENVSEDPSDAGRVVRFQVTDAGGIAGFRTTTVLVTPVNDAPQQGVPGSQSTGQDTALIFSSSGGNAAAVSDVDAAILEVTLTATRGTLSLAGTAGLTLVQGSGQGDAIVSFRGSSAAVNAAMDGLRFDPDSGYAGAARLEIATSDLGASGQGGILQANDVIQIEVIAAEPPSPPGPPPPEPEGEGEPEPDNGGEDPGEEAAPDPGAEEGAPPGGEIPDLPMPQVDLQATAPVQPGVDDVSLPPLAVRIDGPIADPDLPDPDLDRDAGGRRGDEEGVGAPTRPEKLRTAPLPMFSLVEALDDMERTMREDAEEAQAERGLFFSSVQGLALVVSSSLVGALLRGGSLIAMALSSLPLWRWFDPLAVLALTETERRRQAEKLRAEAAAEGRTSEGLRRLLDEDDAELASHGEEERPEA